MKTIYHREDNEGKFKQLVDLDHQALEGLAAAYEKRGAKTKISLLNSCQGLWVLTIEQRAA